MKSADLMIVGAGAAGLMAAIWAARTAQQDNPPRRIILLDGARKIGAKILVAGGGRCNVTNTTVDQRDFAGSTENAIRNVLLRFDAARTRRFFEDELHVPLKEEPGGKLFPVTNRADTVLNALLREIRRLGVELRQSHRVDSITRDHQTALFTVNGTWGQLHAPRIIIATGGRAMPKSGSNGAGYEFVKSLGVTVTPHVFPALVPLVLEESSFIRNLPGITVPDANVLVRTSTGRIERVFAGPVLCTHFGLSGPAILNISRYLADLRFTDPEARLEINWLGSTAPKQVDTTLIHGGADTVAQALQGRLPQRLLDAILETVQCDPATPCAQLEREKRQWVVHALTAMIVPVIGTRGFKFAEATAGGVPLSQLRLKTLETRACPGLHLCGEICDVDGRIGGFNFQWAWSSAYVAGTGV